MIYYDKTFTANQKQWLTLGVPYVAQSTATNYVLLSSKGDFVVDYEISDPPVIPCVSAGGNYDPVAEADKVQAKEKAEFADKQEEAELQSIADGGKKKLEELPLDDKMGNDLSKDPILV